MTGSASLNKLEVLQEQRENPINSEKSDSSFRTEITEVISQRTSSRKYLSINEQTDPLSLITHSSKSGIECVNVN